MTLACLASQSRTELGPAQPQLVILLFTFTQFRVSFKILIVSFTFITAQLECHIQSDNKNILPAIALQEGNCNGSKFSPLCYCQRSRIG